MHRSLRDSIGRFSMRCFALALLVAPANLQSTQAQGVEETQAARSDSVWTAYLQEASDVRSAPEDQGYATQRLDRGSPVEVYQSLASGWSAIRPPSGSFSWIEAKHAYLLPGGKRAEIVENEIPAWIGSQQPIADQWQWQVELVSGQRVEILGEATRQGHGGEKILWYRIAPPPGEFRWVRSSILGPNPPRPVAPASQSAQSTFTARTPSVVPASGSNTRTERSITIADFQEPLELNAAPVPPSRQESLLVEEIEPGTVMEPSPQEPISESQMEPQEFVLGELPGDGGDIPLAEGEWIVDQSWEPGPPGIGGDSIVVSDPHPGVGVDPHFAGWSATSSHPARILVRPLNGILGLIGFSIAEGEVVEGHGHWAADGCGCSACNSSGIAPYGHSMGPFPHEGPSHYAGPHSDLSGGRYTGQTHGSRSASRSAGVPIDSRIDRLPRPVRRYRGEYLQQMIDANTDTSVIPGPDSFLTTPDGILGWNDPEERLMQLDTLTEPLSSQFEGIQLAGAQLPQESQVEPNPFALPDYREAFLRLTQEISRPTEQWDFRELHRWSRERIDQGGSSMEQAEAKRLLERIEEFERLRVKTLYGQTASPSLAPGITTSPAGAGSPPGDASGWLREVHRTRADQPEFAITESSGALIAYVYPAPGLNLRRYINQHVVLYGARGYLPQYAARHITADRVVRTR
ncbi:MAG: hypothetical protein ACK5ZC_08385 [Pirellulaceae bacterium]|jgi:hypothetical protein